MRESPDICAGAAALARSRIGREGERGDTPQEDGETDVSEGARAGRGDVASSRDSEGDANSGKPSRFPPAAAAPQPPRPLSQPARSLTFSPAHMVLPDEVVMRILRFTLEGPPCAEDGGHGGEAGKWSVGGRFKAQLQCRRKRAVAGADLASTSGGTVHPRVAAVARAPLREVCRQWRRLLDATCTHLEVRRALVFGDEELVGLAG